MVELHLVTTKIHKNGIVLIHVLPQNLNAKALFLVTLSYV